MFPSRAPRALRHPVHRPRRRRGAPGPDEALAPADADLVVAFCFGNRPPVDGGLLPEPGPMNEQVARAVVEVLRQADLTVCAQWEVARVLQERYGVRVDQVVGPRRRADGRPRHLTTDEVAAHVAAAHPGARACVVAWRDHAGRCVSASRRQGLVADVPRGVALPAEYDRRSGQWWTRRRGTYLAWDLVSGWIGALAARWL